jgi:predicted regulator of Ras-like GTPase activity (Roadblock/LC7/MglB family)
MESLKHIQTLLTALKKKSQAEAILLINAHGQTIYSTKQYPASELPVISSLVIGLHSAAKQLEKALGGNHSGVFVHEGDSYQLISTSLSNDTLLLIITKHAEYVGYLRFKLKHYHTVLKALVDRFYKEQTTYQNPLANITEEEVDRLLGF